MDSYKNCAINQCKPINYCSNIDDYRPTQSALLTRFTTTDRSELWRTTNQDYGAFYYYRLIHSYTPDNLKAKIYRRQNRFQDWLLYQQLAKSCKIKSNNNNNNNNQKIFPSDRNDTVRITHRRKFNDEFSPIQQNQNNFLPCGEDGLITEYIVKQVLDKLQCLFKPDECQDVAVCAQLLVSDILAQEPCLLADEIIDRVLTIMITPPNTNENKSCNPCYAYNLTKPVCCPSSESMDNNKHQTMQQPKTINNELPFCTIMNTSASATNCNQTMPLSNVFEKLNYLENAISKCSDNLVNQ